MNHVNKTLHQTIYGRQAGVIGTKCEHCLFVCLFVSFFLSFYIVGLLEDMDH